MGNFLLRDSGFVSGDPEQRYISSDCRREIRVFPDIPFVQVVIVNEIVRYELAESCVVAVNVWLKKLGEEVRLLL